MQNFGSYVNSNNLHSLTTLCFYFPPLSFVFGYDGNQYNSEGFLLTGLEIRSKYFLTLTYLHHIGGINNN